MRWAGHVTRMEKKDAYRILLGKPEGKRRLGRPRRRWMDNIKMDLWEIGWGGLDWIDLAQERDQWRAVVNTILNLRVPQGVGKFLSSCTTGGFSRRAQLHKVSLVCWKPSLHNQGGRINQTRNQCERWQADQSASRNFGLCRKKEGHRRQQVSSH
jgi:hypothetical protein